MLDYLQNPTCLSIFDGLLLKAQTIADVHEMYGYIILCKQQSIYCLGFEVLLWKVKQIQVAMKVGITDIRSRTQSGVADRH